MLTNTAIYEGVPYCGVVGSFFFIKTWFCVLENSAVLML